MTPANWISIQARRYHRAGPETLADQRQHHHGAPSRLPDDHQQQLQQVLAQAPPDGGLWTGPKVAMWMSKQIGRAVHSQRGWEALKRAGFSLQIPRPRHHKADLARQDAFKRELPEQIREIQQTHPAAQVELWAMDEHRVGLKPVIRRVWARKGHRPIIRVQQRYKWLYVYGFLCPETGQSHWLLFPSVDSDIFSLALAHFAQEVGTGQHRHMILVLDRAGWHESQEVAVPEGIHLIFLPPDSSELQSCERLWPLTNEAIANRHFATLDELQEAQAARCVALADDPLSLRQHTLFHWWPPSRLEEQDGVVP